MSHAPDIYYPHNDSSTLPETCTLPNTSPLDLSIRHKGRNNISENSFHMVYLRLFSKKIRKQQTLYIYAHMHTIRKAIGVKGKQTFPYYNWLFCWVLRVGLKVFLSVYMNIIRFCLRLCDMGGCARATYNHMYYVSFSRKWLILVLAFRQTIYLLALVCHKQHSVTLHHGARKWVVGLRIRVVKFMFLHYFCAKNRILVWFVLRQYEKRALSSAAFS